MPSDAARLEALGETEVEFGWRGHRVRVPLDLDQWPTEVIRQCRNVAAVEILTADQDVLDHTAVLDDVRDLSQAMAAAIGIERLPEQPDAPDEWFGGIPTLLELLRNHEHDVAADVMERFGVDIDHRFLPVGDDRRVSHRKIWTYVRRTLPQSAVARAKNGGRTVWTEEMFIAAALYEAVTGRHYQGRPMRPEELAAALEAMQAQAAHVAKLKASTARYAPPAPAEPTPAGPAGGPLAAAMAEAVANRRHEMGTNTSG